MDSPIAEIIRLIRDGKVGEARKQAGLDISTVSDGKFMQSIWSLQRGFELIQKGRHTEAYAPLSEALETLKYSHKSDLRGNVSLLTMYCDGIQRLLNGDAHNAFSILDRFAKLVDQGRLFFPQWSLAAEGAKAVALQALARLELSRGNWAIAESHLGVVAQIHEDILKTLDESEPNSLPALCEIYYTKLEAILPFLSMDIWALKYDSAILRIRNVEKAKVKLEAILPGMPDSQIKLVFELIISLIPILKSVFNLAKKIVNERHTLERNEIEKLRALDGQLYPLRQKALRAAERGTTYIVAISQLDQLIEQLLHIGQKAGKKDFGRFGGMVSLVGILVLHFAVHFTVQPTGLQAIWYFLGEVIVGLVVGFGYGALKFKPLLSLYADTIQAKSKRKEGAPAG